MLKRLTTMVLWPLILWIALCSDYVRLDRNRCNTSNQSTRGSSQLCCDPGAENL